MNPLPESVEDFILKYVDSLEELEVLLLLYDSQDQWWTIEKVNDQVKSSISSVAQRVESLSRKKLLLVAESPAESCYKFNLENAELDASVKALAEVYRERRLKVLECLFSKPLSSLRIFSDAFRIRRKDENG